MANQDPLCNPPILDSTLFPIGTAAQDPAFDIFPFLCQLASIASQDNIDPVLAAPKEYDYSQQLNFNGLSAIGDPRFTTGKVMSATMIKFLPRIVTQIEIAQAGGTQIINGYICGADGEPIKYSESVPVISSLAGGGVNLYGYDIPTGLTNEELTQKISSQEVELFVMDFIKTQSQKHADDFITYLQIHYPPINRKYSLHAFKNPPFFYVQIDNIINNTVTNSIYLKYYDDIQTYVANKMVEVGLIASDAGIDVRINSLFDSNAVARAFLAPVPDYTQLLNDENAAVYNNNITASEFSATPKQQYSIISNSLSATPAALNLVIKA